MAGKFFGARLRELRNKADLTQMELAQKAMIARSFVAKLEAGQHVPSWDTVLALAAALGVDCTAFQEAAPADVPAKKKKGKGA
jgi:transcriptional regulator with XRE-family HTH domain